jgi:EpsI family protein
MGTVPLWRCGVIFLLTLTMLIADWLNPALNPPQQSGVVMALPDVVKLQLPDRSAVPFYGSKEPVTEGELGTLPSGTQIVRKQYDDIKGHHSILCTVLLSSAGQNSIHRPEVCLPAQGWTVVGQDNLSIPLASGHALVVRKLSLQRENVTQNNGHRMLHAYFMYWFIGRDMTTPSHYMRVFISSWDRIFYNRAHRWAYAMVMAPITDSDPAGGLDAAQTQAMMTRFISQVVPSFQKSEMSGQESP